jgi:excisionase family DNA binding protein
MAAEPNQYVRPGSIPHAAAKLGVSVPTVYRLIKSKKLRVYRIGRAVRVTDAAIAECICELEADTRAGAR